MNVLTRACWYATWCGACGYKVARRRWIEDVVMMAIATCRAPELVQRTLDGRPPAPILPR
jgi:hypothetical protein